MTNPNSISITRRTLLAGTTASATLAASGLSFGLTGKAAAASAAIAPAAETAASHALCIAHHQELSQHLSKVLNAAYVDERMKNTMLTTTRCPHCQVAIAPGEKTRAAFAALS